MPSAKRYWLVKSEPDVYSFDHLWSDKGRRTLWDGVRNYQARNTMRDDMQVGDGVLFYHSNAKPPGVAGIAEVASKSYPDPTQFDPAHKYFDEKSKVEDPRWWLVDIRAKKKVKRFVSLDELKANPKLSEMALCQRGSRLSVQPVRPSEWRIVLAMCGL